MWHTHADNVWLSCVDLTLRLPGAADRVLLDSLNIRVPAHGGLLISGLSGSGRTTLVRAISGLWRCGDGLIQREDNEQVSFPPQRPYMQLGTNRTMREQLLYPYQRRNKHTDKTLKDVLTSVSCRSMHATVTLFVVMGR